MTRRYSHLAFLAAVALFCLTRLVCAELVPPTVTEVPNPLNVQEHEYHWWDVFTSHAAEYLGPKLDTAEQMADRAQHDAAKAGKHVTSKASKLGEKAADSAEDLAESAKHHVGLFGHKVKREGEKVADSAEDLAQNAKDRAEQLGRNAKQEGEKLGERARQAAENARQAGMAAHKRVDAQGRRVMHNAERAMNDLDRRQQGVFRSIYDRITDQVCNSGIRGAGSHLRAELKSGMEKLGDMLATIGQGASPSWPEAVFEGTKDPMFTTYIHELGHASKQANAQIQSTLDAHMLILEKMVHAHLSAQLPLASTYVPVLTLLLMYLVNSVWTRKNELRRRARLQAQASESDEGYAQASQREYELVSDAVSTGYAYLVLIPMAVALLVVMELSGMATWLITSSYTCLIAGTLVAGQPSFLVNVWSSDDITLVGQRLAIGVTTMDAVFCFIHAVFG
ncbi:hypothetical protein GGF43_002124 [Coemansia sp. RSA 2618]|nr:hypothetical protein GGF43_002124 [Coemansia sp. RSA 2618]